jgi:hypothetical protein
MIEKNANLVGLVFTILKDPGKQGPDQIFLSKFRVHFSLYYFIHRNEIPITTQKIVRKFEASHPLVCKAL